MRKTGRCILSAVIAVLLMIGAIDYAFVIGKAKLHLRYNVTIFHSGSPYPTI
mgnify:CR=1 FL=1